MVDIYLLRHAHVDYVPPATITAQTPLTELGHRMARRLAERCADWDLQRLYVSPFLRARQTADAISARFPDLPRYEMPAFAEASIVDLADWEGPQPDEDMNTWQDGHYAHANERMWGRVLRGFERIQGELAAEGLERVAIVAHGGPFNALVRAFLGNDRTVRLRTCWLRFEWASTACLAYGPAGCEVRWLNDARHVEDLLPLA
jgi:broad specificity phosphatase PhoE